MMPETRHESTESSRTTERSESKVTGADGSTGDETHTHTHTHGDRTVKKDGKIAEHEETGEAGFEVDASMPPGGTYG